MAANPGFFPEGSEGVADILKQVFQPARAAGVAALLLDLLRTAKRKAGLPACFVWSVALRHQLLRVLLDVEAEFLLELCFHVASPPQASPPCHGVPPSAMPRMRPMASINRCQLAASASSCFRPFRVSL
jgi:hypothetical protein